MGGKMVRTNKVVWSLEKVYEWVQKNMIKVGVSLSFIHPCHALYSMGKKVKTSVFYNKRWRASSFHIMLWKRVLQIIIGVSSILTWYSTLQPPVRLSQAWYSIHDGESVSISMTLNCVWQWGSSSGVLRRVQLPLCWHYFQVHSPTEWMLLLESDLWVK